ncbi:uncharacterized protein DSM5745_03740 [Aspergillus mulundensis]|uniref:F-box domain-containing protein n=1 Tax=Aspergillus mulundensis TaxID=1810919 RepID=A0A3D8SMS6_9EURO|nr:hypothetical protein DSM5745_03740 [Aspergillus mulundensis]RDW87098.1 hypothetical protein DSM5745_03740 [Aspergillus mulundensis]
MASINSHPPLYTLPTEVLQMVFGFVAGDDHDESDGTNSRLIPSLRELWSISATSGWFRAVVERLQYRNVLLSRPNQHRHLLRTLARKPYLVGSVKQLVFFTNARACHSVPSPPLEKCEHPDRILELCDAAFPGQTGTAWVSEHLRETRDAVIDLFDLLPRLLQLKRFRYAPFLTTDGVLRLDRSYNSVDPIPGFHHFFVEILSSLTPAAVSEIHLFERLEDLHFSGATAHVVNLALSLPKLHTLRLSHIPSLPTAGAIPLNTSSTIRTLSFVSRYIQELQIIPAILTAVPQLETLHIETTQLETYGATNGAIFENIAQALATHLHTLKHLTLDIALAPGSPVHFDFRAFTRLSTLSTRDTFLFDAATPAKSFVDSLPSRLVILDVKVHGSTETSFEMAASLARDVQRCRYEHVERFRYLESVSLDFQTAHPEFTFSAEEELTVRAELRITETQFLELGVVYEHPRFVIEKDVLSDSVGGSADGWRVRFLST